MKFVYLLIILKILLAQIKSQNNTSLQSQTKLKEIEDNLLQLNLLYQNITEEMASVKYNIVLKYRYTKLVQKKEKIETKLNQVKYGAENTENDFDELNRFVHNFSKSCNKFQKLYNNFENLKNIIINIIKIFFLTLLIIILAVIIISSLIYLYVYRKRKSYEALQEEMSHSNFQNITEPELEKIKEKKNKKKRTKRKENNKENDEDINNKESDEKKIENIEVLDDK